MSIVLCGCSSGNSQPKMKNMSEIEKLTKAQFAEETAAFNYYVVKEMEKILDKHSKVDADFENAITNLHNSSMKQMIEYGKVLDKKDEETKSDYVIESLMVMWDNIDEVEGESFEEKFDKRITEFEAFGSESLERKFNDLFGLMDFLNLKEAKEMHPETAKEFGIE